MSTKENLATHPNPEEWAEDLISPFLDKLMLDTQDAPDTEDFLNPSIYESPEFYADSEALGELDMLSEMDSDDQYAEDLFNEQNQYLQGEWMGYSTSDGTDTVYDEDEAEYWQDEYDFEDEAEMEAGTDEIEEECPQSGELDTFVSEQGLYESSDAQEDEIPAPPPMKRVKLPMPIPEHRPIPFAEEPPLGSYWPIRTSSACGRVVTYLAEDGKFVLGRQRSCRSYGRTFLANRNGKKGARWHLGVDLYAHAGDPVVACEDGVIRDWRYFYRAKSGQKTYKILIEHSNAVVNYGEVTPDSLKKTGLTVGSTVRAGQLIGFVSDTKMLHFETYTKGTQQTYQWWKSKSRPPERVLNPTKYLLFLQEFGLAGIGASTAEPLPTDGPGRDTTGSDSLGKSLLSHLTGLGIKGFNIARLSFAVLKAHADGSLNKNTLTDLIFYHMFPSQKGAKLRPNDPLTKVWGKIQADVSMPVLQLLSQSQRPYQQPYQEPTPTPAGGNLESFDVERAITQNRKYAARLGWDAMRQKISFLLGFTLYIPGEKTFAMQVAQWQKKHGLEADGVIGPTTWARMRGQIEGAEPTTQGSDDGFSPDVKLGSVRYSDGTIKKFTPESVLWFARMIDGETWGKPSEDDARSMLWALVQRSGIWRYKFWDWTKFIRSYSQPISPKWTRTGSGCRKYYTSEYTASGRSVPDRCSIKRVTRREENVRKRWEDLHPIARRITLEFVAGNIRNHIPGAVGWFAPGTWRSRERNGHNRKSHMVFHSEIDGNVYFSMSKNPNTRNWDGSEVTILPGS
ncbi:MAG: peptidoglycan DD-metalloendopeptidase family protein [Gammaproteobacteria bacterium]|nr:peptidoglycan DD-metalloendopeptidase family protein [Gammaproteobacteria bacterium]MDH5801602.1 peptidoglycan DD-metalloendopeptidase family protein [Gammaproteobacteria bacterium]